MRNKSDPDTISYLQQENDYATFQLSQASELQQQIYQEMESRYPTGETNTPIRHGNYVYYSTYLSDQNYETWLRRDIQTK